MRTRTNYHHAERLERARAATQTPRSQRQSRRDAFLDYRVMRKARAVSMEPVAPPSQLTRSASVPMLPVPPNYEAFVGGDEDSDEMREMFWVFPRAKVPGGAFDLAREKQQLVLGQA